MAEAYYEDEMMRYYEQQKREEEEMIRQYEEHQMEMNEQAAPEIADWAEEWLWKGEYVKYGFKVDDEEEEKEHEEVEDKAIDEENELLLRCQQGLGKRQRLDGSAEKWLHDFDPEFYMSERDTQIRDTDIPERIQILEENTGPEPTDESSIEEEGAWIHNQLITNYKSLLVKNTNELVPNGLSLKLKEDIFRFLKLLHVDKFDIPFIAMYRKESCPTLLKDPQIDKEIGNVDKDTPKLKWHKVLWAIKDLVKQWLLLQKRKNVLQSYYNKHYEEESRQIYKNKMRLKLNQKIFESVNKSLKIAESEREVDDVDSKFNLHFPPGEIGADAGRSKRPKRESFYNICSNSGLWEVADKIGYNFEHRGLDVKESPEDVASSFTCAMFETPQAVLKGRSGD